MPTNIDIQVNMPRTDIMLKGLLLITILNMLGLDFIVKGLLMITILNILAKSNIPRVNGTIQRPAELPSHITQEFLDMAIQLNKTYTCPCCYELVNKETIHITFCGHILCKGCLDQIVSPKKCPTCRKGLSD